MCDHLDTIIISGWSNSNNFSLRSFTNQMASHNTLPEIQLAIFKEKHQMERSGSGNHTAIHAEFVQPSPVAGNCGNAKVPGHHRI